ncbi:hypothetical protein IAT38_007496 [Cryptococcus sp. DSM 104549]
MPITPPATPDGRGRRAWVTLVTNPSYVAGLLCLHRTISSLSSYPLLVMTTPTLPASYTPLLESLGMTLIPVSHLAPSASQHPGFDPSFTRLNDAWTKLQVFGLQGYDKVVLVDADMIFLTEMDELFDVELPGRDWIGAAPACVCNPLKLEHYPKDWIPANCSLSIQSSPTPLLSPPIPSPTAPRTAHLLNSGLVLLHPSPQLLASLIHLLHTSPSIAEAKFADQDVIAEAFHGRWRPLPWWCNALKTERAVHKELWRDEEVRVIHYILDKPWNARPKVLPTRPAPASPALPPSPTSDEGSPQRRPALATATGRPSLPAGLLDAVRNTPEQKSLTEYGEVNEWWWIVYGEVLEGLKARGEDWEAVDKWVAQE